MQTATNKGFKTDTTQPMELKRTSFFGARLREATIGRTIILPILFIIGSCWLWIISLPLIDPGKMSDLGLVSVLPMTFFAALAVLTVSFFATLSQVKSREFILLLHIILLIFIIHATPQLVYGTLRYSWAWKHVGIVDFIQRNGTVNPSITDLNAYHNWPGFFSFFAFFNSLAGLESSLSYAGWGPVYFNLLDLIALLALFKNLSIDRRLGWLAAWFFFLFNWIGQDYFSPQALSFFFFLVSITLILRWFRVQKLPFRSETPSFQTNHKISNLYHKVVNQGVIENFNINSTTRAQRLMFVAVLLLNFFVIASSHQLTPLMLISAITALIIFRMINQPFLSILLLVITADWVIFMAVGFLNGNLYWIVRSIGSLLENVNGNLINLAISSPGQILIAKIDRALSAFAWVLGIGGLVRRFKSGHWDVPAALLAFAPIPIIAINSYGGEILFRIYLFSLPFIAFLAAGLFYPSLKSGTSFKVPFLSTILSLILILGFLFSYYGKERMYYFSPNEVAAAKFVYQNVPKGSVIVDGEWDWPRQYTHYEDYYYQSFFLLPPASWTTVKQDPKGILFSYVAAAARKQARVDANLSLDPNSKDWNRSIFPSVNSYPAAYIVITRSQIAEVEMTGGLTPDFFLSLIQAMANSPHFKVVYSNPDAVIYTYSVTGVFK